MSAPEPAPSPINQVLDAARAALEARRLELLDRAAKITAAADAYVKAAEQGLVADLARKLGLEAPAGESVEAAARSLRDCVLDLPELGASKPGVAVLGPVPPTPPTPAVVPMRSHLDAYEASPEAKALWNELKSLDFETMPIPLFKATAAELAARARVLQCSGESAELIPERVIKGLTARAAKRGIRGIYGLAQHHEGDWPELVRRAKAERVRLQNGSNGLTHKLQFPEAVVQQVAEKPPSRPTQDDELEDDPETPGDYPKLREAATKRPVVLMGGIPKQSKLQKVAQRLGFEPEWIETQNAVRGVQSLEKRILDQNISAVVILEGLIGHPQFKPIITATRQTGTPVAYGDTAGTGALRRAFLEIEQKLQGGPGP